MKMVLLSWTCCCSRDYNQEEHCWSSCVSLLDVVRIYYSECTCSCSPSLLKEFPFVPQLCQHLCAQTERNCLCDGYEVVPYCFNLYFRLVYLVSYYLFIEYNEFHFPWMSILSAYFFCWVQAVHWLVGFFFQVLLCSLEANLFINPLLQLLLGCGLSFPSWWYSLSYM